MRARSATSSTSTSTTTPDASSTRRTSSRSTTKASRARISSRVDVGNINFAPPSSRFLTSSLPSGNYGVQAIAQFGRLHVQGDLRPADRQHRSEAPLHRRPARSADHRPRRRRSRRSSPGASSSRSIRRCSEAYPNIDILNRSQLDALAQRRCPTRCARRRVLLYRVQFGDAAAEPERSAASGCRAMPAAARRRTTCCAKASTTTWIRRMLWFALVRPLNETNERLVVAYNVRINGRDTVWVTTGGTPDLQVVTTRDQVANLVWDPNRRPVVAGVSPTRFARCIASPARSCVRQLDAGARRRPAAGLLEQSARRQRRDIPPDVRSRAVDESRRVRLRQPPLAAHRPTPSSTSAPAQPTCATPTVDSMSPRSSRDYFLDLSVAASVLARATSGLVVPGNPTNEAIYTTPGEYLYSSQHPASVYRHHVCSYRIHRLGRRRAHHARRHADAAAAPSAWCWRAARSFAISTTASTTTSDASSSCAPTRCSSCSATSTCATRRIRGFAPTPTTLAGFVSELPFSHGVINFSAINQSQSTNVHTAATRLSSIRRHSPRASRRNSVGMRRADAARQPAAVREPRRPRRTFRSQARDREQPSAIRRAQPGQGVRRDLRGHRRHHRAARRYRVGTTAACRRTDTRCAVAVRRCISVRAQSRGDAGVADQRADARAARRIQFTRSSIDPLAAFAGTGAEPNETVLWLTLLPLDRGGRYDRAKPIRLDGSRTRRPAGGGGRFGRCCSPAGLDLSGGELLEFWTLVDTERHSARGKNPTLVFDFGDVSENSLRFAPETLTVVPQHRTAPSTACSPANKLQGFDIARHRARSVLAHVQRRGQRHRLAGRRRSTRSSSSTARRSSA